MTLDVRTISRAQFDVAKRRWAWALGIKVAMFVIGLWSALGAGWTYTPQALLGLAIISELLQLASDHAKGKAEVILRMLDRCRSFGRKISDADLRDLALAAPKKLRISSRYQGDDQYFATTEAAGPRTAVLNLLESAWYTRHQALRMCLIFGTGIAICIGGAIAALLVVSRATVTADIREHVVKAVTAWLLLVVSLSMLKSVFGYWKMARRCEKTEQVCTHLLAEKVSEIDALREWYEYQIGRVAAPLIPEWLWQLMRKDLDQAWAAREG